jgi:hypothetical protein
MDPEITTGTRKRLTELDAAALRDIGWEVTEPTINYNPADFNEDTLVNGVDLTAWRGSFGENANADADGDGDTDGADFLIWQKNFGATSIVPSGLAAFAAVPEPHSALVAAGMSAGLWAIRRNKR